MFSELFLRGDTDPDWDYILRGICFGFRVINPDCHIDYQAQGRRVRDPVDHAVVTEKLKGEIDRGCVSVVCDRPSCVHDIFCVPKEGGGARAIVDCSKPTGCSVNSHTDQVSVKFRYKSVDNVAELMERGDYLSTVDIKDAYRAIAIHPRDRDRQGLHWDFDPLDPSACTYMKDNRLCMGLSSSPYVFSKISDFVVRCAVREGTGRVVNYLDDFCVISSDFAEGCRDQSVIMAILRRLGFHISFSKLVSPSTSARFLGIIIDTVSLEMSLPQDKLDKLVAILRHFKGRRKATRRDLERLGGLLAHCSKVIRGGRTFCRRIYDSMSSVREPYFKVRLGSGFREDIAWWCDFAATFNGKAKILGRFAAHISTYSDASSWGFGATHGPRWVVGAFDPGEDEKIGARVGHHHFPPEGSCAEAHINTREMWAVLSAAINWAHLWGNSSVVMVTDSTTVRAALNTGRSRSPAIMGFLRRLFWLSVEHNFEFSAVYIRSAENVICDALSRLGVESSWTRIREADRMGCMCCHVLFTDSDSLCAYRGREPGGGEEGIPEAGIRP